MDLVFAAQGAIRNLISGNSTNNIRPNNIRPNNIRPNKGPIARKSQGGGLRGRRGKSLRGKGRRFRTKRSLRKTKRNH
jgi:hypothetical protein